jgi:glycosyltransferase involved in cell wall biosynthesis
MSFSQQTNVSDHRAVSAAPSRSVYLAAISLHRMAGGLERNIVRLANALAVRGYRVGIVTFDLPDAESFYPIDDRISWTKAGESPAHGRVTFRQRLRVIGRCRAVITASDRDPIVVCFHHGILIRFLLAALFTRAKVLCSERNSLSHYDFIRRGRWNLNFLALAFAARVIVQFPSYITDYPRWVRSRIVAIANPVLPAPAQARSAVPTEKGRFILLSVARFSHQKNLDILIRAFSDLAGKHKDWDLYLLGDGERRGELETLVRAKGLEHRVFMPGNAGDMDVWYAKSHLFCLPSKWEGFPNALAEALAHGLPAIGYQGCAGVRDLITSGENGLLATGNGDVVALTECLETLLGDAQARTRMGDAAIVSMSAYQPSAIFSLWDRLLSSEV